MATITPIHSGLGGAIGCDYQVSRNRLVFVEYSGKLSAINGYGHIHYAEAHRTIDIRA